MDAKNVYDGIRRLVEASSAREHPKPVNNREASGIAENGEVPKMDNGETPDAKESEAINTESEATKTDEANKISTSPTGQEDTNLEKSSTSPTGQEDTNLEKSPTPTGQEDTNLEKTDE